MQTPSGHTPIGELWNSIQSWLFPVLEEEIGALDEKHRQLVAVCELCAPQDSMATYRWIGNGCPPSDRLALCKAFIAKAVWGFATTRDLIDALRLADAAYDAKEIREISARLGHVAIIDRNPRRGARRSGSPRRMRCAITNAARSSG